MTYSSSRLMGLLKWNQPSLNCRFLCTGEGPMTTWRTQPKFPTNRPDPVTCLLGTKPTWAWIHLTSATDPKRTFQSYLPHWGNQVSSACRAWWYRVRQPDVLVGAGEKTSSRNNTTLSVLFRKPAQAGTV